MPELPEVETIRRWVAPILTGRRFEGVEILDPRLTRPHDPQAVAAKLAGECVATLDRRGKYLIVRFASGRALVIHLRMTGALFYAPPGRLAEDPHRRAVVGLDDGSTLGYRDVRRFGTWLIAEPGELQPYFEERLGVEPLGSEFSAKMLEGRLAGRKAPIKAALLDQRTTAGVGNIYADEALWCARVHPSRLAGELAAEELRRLVPAIRDVLRAGIRRQGATLTDYRMPDGGRGSMQEEFKVYGRAGEPCPRCGTPIDKIRVAGRGTWYCPTCQVR